MVEVNEVSVNFTRSHLVSAFELRDKQNETCHRTALWFRDADTVDFEIGAQLPPGAVAAEGTYFGMEGQWKGKSDFQLLSYHATP